MSQYLDLDHVCYLNFRKEFLELDDSSDMHMCISDNCFQFDMIEYDLSCSTRTIISVVYE